MVVGVIMFVIITYDIEVKRIDKVRKLLKKYLTWTQNSVFEGEITLGKLHQCLAELNDKIMKDDDSVYIYRIENSKNITKEVVGLEKNFNDLFM